MFRKLISNLPFSPSLVGQLGFYSKRLRREEVTRRMGLIFVALALVVQSFAVFNPPESANASAESDMVYGGMQSINDFLVRYDSNTRYLHDVMNHVGITRDEIAASQFGSWSSAGKYSWGFAPGASYEQGERQVSILDASGQQVTTVYTRPQTIRHSPNEAMYGWIGESKTIGWFAILQDCGNVVTNAVPNPKCLLNSGLLADDERCKPCPGNDSLWIGDQSCIPNIIESKTATNTSQGFVSASSVTARASDQISYTITIENTGLSPKTVELKDYLVDVLEYSTLIDNGGGTLNKTTNILSWPDVTLNPKDKQTRTFVVKLLDTIPATPVGKSNEMSYDCIMTNVFGNAIDIRVDCPTTKIIETVSSELPRTGPTENMIFAGMVLAVTTYFYARNRQMKKEVCIIRRDVSTGTI